MNSYCQILYHLVFCTYKRKNTLTEKHQESLYKFIRGIINNRKGMLYVINGTENHIHILSDLHPNISLSDYIKEIKTASNKWMKASGKFPDFEAWAEGSCALTYSIRDKEMLMTYIKNQAERIQEYMHSRPELVPVYMKLDLFENDIRNKRILDDFLLQIKILKECIEDTSLLVNSDIYKVAISFYRSVRLASVQNVPGTTSIYQELAAQFKGRPVKAKKKNTESSKAGDETEETA